MSDEHIQLLKSKLVELNPLGERANTILDLNDYQTETVDILFHVNKKDSRIRTEKIIRSVFEQAFYLELNEQDCKELTELVMKLKKEDKYE